MLQNVLVGVVETTIHGGRQMTDKGVIERFEKDRNESLFSLDEKKIKARSEKWLYEHGSSPDIGG
jgi:hypothetical protein